MPSSRDLPSIDAYIDAAAKGLRAQRGEQQNDRRGGMWERSFAGSAAILWTREAARDRDMFRAIHFDSATGDGLTNLADRYGVPRTLDTYGLGTAVVRRASVGGGAGTLWAGTQIALTAPAGGQSIYTVASDTTVGATVDRLPVTVQATVKGSAGALELSAGASFVDQTFDAALYVESLQCDAGQDLEQPDAYRARARTELRARRVGYTPRMVDALRAAGATKAVLLPADYSGVALDGGVSVCYVGDDGFNGTASLVTACKLALESVRVLGCDLLVLPMSAGLATIAANLTLWDSAYLARKTEIDARARAAVARYFADPTNGFAYKRDAIAGAITSECPEVMEASLTSPGVDATLSASAWPATLTIYRVLSSSVQLTFV